MPVGISHLLDVCQASYGESLTFVNVPRGVFVRLVDVASDDVAPVLIVCSSGVLRRCEAVDELAVGIWEFNVLIDLVGDPLDFELLEPALACRGEFLASLTQYPVTALDRVHPDPVVVVAEREEVGTVGFEEGHPGMEVFAHAVRFLLLRRASAKAGEIKHVAKVDLVVRLPVLAKVEELLDRDRAAKLAVVVASDDEFFEAHSLFS